MAELAAGGTAAGFISLGLQVCSGLIIYCSAFKDIDKDHKRIIRRTQGLSDILEHLSSLLSSSTLDELPSSTRVKDRILECAEGIQELDTMLKGYTDQGFGSQHLSRVTKNYVQRVLYPFRKSDLTSLNATLSDLQDNLNSALQLLQMYGK